MNKRNVWLLAAAALVLTACGEPEKTTDKPDSAGSSADVPAQESQKDVQAQESQKPEPASQEYVSSDGTFKVILPEGLEQTDMQLQAGSSMMGLEGGSSRKGFSAVALGSAKTSVPGNPGELESLEDYADYITGMILDGSGVTVDWENADAPSMEGAEQCIAREGTAKSGGGSGQAYGYYAATPDSYYSVVIIGNDDDVEEARQVLALELADVSSAQKGTTDFIDGMTAVLDSVNGASLRSAYKMLVDTGADESQLEQLASNAQQSLSSSWDIDSKDDLMETADWLMEEGHNKGALEALASYDGTDRDAFESSLKEQGVDDGTRISLMAAYDAWAAYGDSAIAAWDLSRVGTIMGFGYAGGYCTYEEAMDKMLEAAEKSQELFDSWEDFNQSYLYGYSYWAEESLDDPDSSAAERASLVDSLEAQANGPFSAAWDMKLEKEW